MDAREVCLTCTQNCMLLHGEKKVASVFDKSFIKILFGNHDFSKYLYLPPLVSQTIPVLGDGQPHVLEDCNGQRWPVTLGCSNGALAFEKGWELFYADHDLKEGYILQFNFLQSHFLVKIYDTTCTPKLKFSKANVYKRERSNGNESAKEPRSQKISDDLTKKQVSTTSVASRSECRTQGQQMTKDKPSHVSVTPVAANRMHSQLMNNDKRPSSQNGDGTCSFISRPIKLGVYNRRQSQPRQSLPPLVVNPDNLPSPENKDGRRLVIKDKPSGSSVISGSDNRIQSQLMTMYKPPSSADGYGGQKISSTTLVKFSGENGKERQVLTKDKPLSISVGASTGNRTQWQLTSKEKPSGSQNGNGGFKPPSTTTVREENRRENQIMRKEKPTGTSVILRPSDQVQIQPVSKDKTLNSENGNSGLKLPSTTFIISRAENRGEIKGMTKDKPTSTNVISVVGDRTQSKLMLKDKPEYAEYKYKENMTHLYDLSGLEDQGRVNADGSIDRTHPSNTLVELTSILNENPASKNVQSGEPSAEYKYKENMTHLYDLSGLEDQAIVNASNTLVELKTRTSWEPSEEVANLEAFSNSSISDTATRKNVAVVEYDHKGHLSGLPLPVKKRILVHNEDTTKRSMMSKIVKCQETAGRNKQSGELMKIPEKESDFGPCHEQINSGELMKVPDKELELGPSHEQINSGKDNEVCNVVQLPVESSDQACLGTSCDTCKAVVKSTDVGLRGPDN